MLILAEKRTYQCRRKIKLEAYNDEKIIKNVIVLDPNKDYKLFTECPVCPFGTKTMFLDRDVLPKTAKACTFREVKTCQK